MDSRMPPLQRFHYAHPPLKLKTKALLVVKQAEVKPKMGSFLHHPPNSPHPLPKPISFFGNAKERVDVD
jgi:hypothetical protein